MDLLFSLVRRKKQPLTSKMSGGLTRQSSQGYLGVRGEKEGRVFFDAKKKRS